MYTNNSTRFTLIFKRCLIYLPKRKIQVSNMNLIFPQRENLKIAQQYFQLVGGSASECDTIPGRQCMASCFFLLKQFDDVLLYLNSIKSYFHSDDTFNFNYAQVSDIS